MARDERRLAAIVAADIAGYSSLVGRDESGTIAALKAHRQELLDPLIQEHGGRIIKTMGDGLLMEFGSVVNATQCAILMQQGMVLRNADVEPDRRIAFRMGLNLGDVIIDGDDLLGDGVNVAARLEALAAVNGLCLSAKARDELHGKLALECTDGGEQTLKNIATPIRVYHWSPGGMAATPAALPRAATRDRRPSVRLMPFEAGGESEHDRSLANSVAEEIALPLANLTGIRLVATGAPADYLVRGRAQVFGNRARVTITLLDQVSQQQFWSERFDADLSNLFLTLDELALRVSTALRFEIYARETVKAKNLADAELSDDDRKAQAGHILLGAQHSDYERSRALIEPLIARRPDDFMALGIRAAITLQEVICGWRDVAPDEGRLGLELARRAITLNERSDFVHFILGNIHLHFEHDSMAANREASRSLELNPHYILAMDLLGLTQIFTGDAEGGITLCRKAVEVGPRFPARGWFMQSVALGHFVLGDDASAIEWCRRADQHERDVPRCLLILIAAAAREGDRELAREGAGRLVATAPDFSLGQLRTWPFRDAQLRQRFVAGLRDAGLPA